MYTSFSIENFRLFDRLAVESLARVNLIAGENNVGKTALLEALWMLSRPSAAFDAFPHTRRRGASGQDLGELFANLFLNYDTSLAIGLRAKDQSGNGTIELDITSQARSERPIVDWSSVSETEFVDESIEDFDLSSQLQIQHTNESGHLYCTTAWLDAETKSGMAQAVVRQNTLPASTSNRPCEFEAPGKRYTARRLAALFGEAQRGNYVPYI